MIQSRRLPPSSVARKRPCATGSSGRRRHRSRLSRCERLAHLQEERSAAVDGRSVHGVVHGGSSRTRSARLHGSFRDRADAIPSDIRKHAHRMGLRAGRERVWRCRTLPDHWCTRPPLAAAGFTTTGYRWASRYRAAPTARRRSWRSRSASVGNSFVPTGALPPRARQPFRRSAAVVEVLVHVPAVSRRAESRRKAPSSYVLMLQ